MDAIHFLKKEHDHVRRMLFDISDESHHYETKIKMFNELCQDLIRHETMEHKVWYPHLKNKVNKTVEHLLREEKIAEKTIKNFENINDEKIWEEKFSKFKKDVENHANEEEQKLFPIVKNILSESELEKIGNDMYQFKRNYQTSSFTN